MKRERCNVYLPDGHKVIVTIKGFTVHNRKVATRKPNRARFPRYALHINELPLA